MVALASSTRDLAIGTDAVLKAHIETDRQFQQSLRDLLADSKAERATMHAENKADIKSAVDKIEALDDKVSREVGKLHGRVDMLLWKIIGGLAALVMASAGFLAYLLRADLPHL